MSDPKIHHYVPRFYLNRFADTSGQIWAWDKSSNKIFPVGASRIAAERDFYRIPWLAEQGHDPLTMEKQFSGVEADVAKISDQWIRWLRDANPGDKIPIPHINREIFALFMCLQYLRTADHRDILGAFAAEKVYGRDLSASELRDLHTELLWSEKTIRPLQRRLQKATWVFARNRSLTPYATSDAPLLFKTGDNLQWVKIGVMSREVYSVLPLAPDIILYCHPQEGKWAKLRKFDCCLSPITISDAMAEQDNTGQVFGASRFVFSNNSNFEFARDFASTIGTDFYAPKA